MVERLEPGKVSVTLTRDSVCMADDVEAPHEQVFAFDADLDLLSMATEIARTGYLPMPSDAWGWTIEHGSAAVAIRPRLLTTHAICLRGNPACVRAGDVGALVAIYVRPTSKWRTDCATAPAVHASWLQRLRRRFRKDV